MKQLKRIDSGTQLGGFLASTLLGAVTTLKESLLAEQSSHIAFKGCKALLAVNKQLDVVDGNIISAFNLMDNEMKGNKEWRSEQQEKISQWVDFIESLVGEAQRSKFEGRIL